MKLTAREREIGELLSLGLCAKEIGVRLNIATKTVDVHRYNLMRKLGVHTQGHLVRRMIELGYINIGTSLIRPEQFEALAHDTARYVIARITAA